MSNNTLIEYLNYRSFSIIITSTNELSSLSFIFDKANVCFDDGRYIWIKDNKNNNELSIDIMSIKEKNHDISKGEIIIKTDNMEVKIIEE